FSLLFSFACVTVLSFHSCCASSSSYFFLLFRFWFFVFFFFFNDTATTEIYTLSLHDALPISPSTSWRETRPGFPAVTRKDASCRDRKSTRLNSSHDQISYAVFCLKKKKKKNKTKKLKHEKRQQHLKTNRTTIDRRVLIPQSAT